jgi:hypothetical protein
MDRASVWYPQQMTKTTRASLDTSSADFRARAERRRATWTITRYRSLDEMKAAEYAFWARQPTHAVMTAVSELSAELYAMKGVHVSRLQRARRASEQA